MSDDLVSRLRDERITGAMFLRLEAATALTEARAEIEVLKGMLSDMEALKNTYRDDCLLAESELSTLRARVREVVGGMLAHSCVADAGQDCKDEEDEAAERGARQLMEDLTGQQAERGSP